MAEIKSIQTDEEHAWCSRFKADFPVAKECSTLDAPLDICYDLCSIFHTAELNDSCKAYWTANSAARTSAEQNAYCSAHTTEPTVALACSQLNSQDSLLQIHCMNLVVTAINTEFKNCWASTYSTLTDSEQLSFCTK